MFDFGINLVLVAGLEPAWYCYQWILSPSRLPISPHERIHIHYNKYHSELQAVIFDFYHI